ncbi:MAG: phosphate signaling complex protein PhoU [Candidatus Omnitrophota bacterium]|nr:phosphate signaling complex protein PhoU [Candidatus Omnitrophota bacterium]
MKRHFDEELADLKEDILDLGSLVELAILNSVNALKNLNRQQAERMIVKDKEIDEWELKIDEKCLNLLALRQPMAFDLRFIAMAIKIGTDLERIADLAVDIAQRVLELADKPLLKPLIDIPKLTIVAQEMLRDTLKSFVKQDVELAKQVILRDKEADSLRDLVQTELINDYMIKDVNTISRAIPLLLIARYLERICDHATNIAEDVIYMVKAKVVKHHPEKLVNNHS